MKSVVILANGVFPATEKTLNILRSADTVICCDGAAAHLVAAGIEPDIIVGDMDSIPVELMEKYSSIIRKIDEQETNDLTKAFGIAKKLVSEEDFIHILGATGMREDHTLANISLLAEYTAESPCRIDMISDYGRFIAETDSCVLNGVPGTEISIFAFDNTLRVHSEGLEFSTDSVKFNSLWPATLNRVEKTPFNLKLSHPAKIIIYFAD